MLDVVIEVVEVLMLDVVVEVFTALVLDVVVVSVVEVLADVIVVPIELMVALVDVVISLEEAFAATTNGTATETTSKATMHIPPKNDNRWWLVVNDCLLFAILPVEKIIQENWKHSAVIQNGR